MPLTYEQVFLHSPPSAPSRVYPRLRLPRLPRRTLMVQESKQRGRTAYAGGARQQSLDATFLEIATNNKNPERRHGPSINCRAEGVQPSSENFLLLHLVVTDVQLTELLTRAQGHGDS